jgi:hypothetical protein
VACAGVAIATVAAQPRLSLPRPGIERREPELRRFRDGLLAALRERRLPTLRDAIAPTVVDQDTEVPRQEILAALGPLTPGQPLPPEWRALEQALELGGVRRGEAYVVPYMEAAVEQWKPRLERLFVAGRDVALHRDADAASPIVARLSDTLVLEAPLVSVQETPGAACRHWTPVLLDGRAARWICTASTRPISGPYYAFTRAGGAWRLTRIWSIRA